MKPSLKDRPLYFSSTKGAVEIISELLRQQNWAELSRYYDLENTTLNPEELLSGRYFYRPARPEVSHPGGFSRFKEPFAPGFFYDGEILEKSQDGYDIIKVNLRIRIDEGGGVFQEGLDCFFLKKTKNGYRILTANGP